MLPEKLATVNELTVSSILRYLIIFTVSANQPGTSPRPCIELVFNIEAHSFRSTPRHEADWLRIAS